MFQCDKKDIGLVKSWQVFNVLPQAEFNLCQISMDDPRLDDAAPTDSGPAKRYVWALEMTAEEWQKLYQAAFPGKSK